MAVFEVQGPDGSIYEIDAPDEGAALSAFQGFIGGQQGVQKIAPIAPAASAPPVPATAQSRSSQLMDAAMAAPDEATYRRLMAEANAAAVADGETPAGIAMNPRTGQLHDLSSPISPYVSGTTAAAGQIGAMHGLAMGGADEAVAAAYSPFGPGTMGQNYAWANARADEQLRRSREAHPYATGAAEIAGGAATGIAATGRMAAAKTLGGKLMQAGTIGTGTGALYGGLSADGGAEERGKGALLGGLLGAATGAASVPAEIALRNVGNSVIGAIGNVSTKVKPARVEAALAQALAGSGKSSDEVAAAVRAAQADGQGVYALADALGPTGQRELSGAVRLGGAARRIGTEALEARQAGQGERIGAALADALDVRTTAAAREEAMKAARSNAASTAYSAARKGAGPVDVRGALGAIDDRIGPMQGGGIKGDGIDAKLTNYRARLAANNPAAASPKGGAGLAPEGYDSTPTAVELSDFDRVLGVKQAIQDDIGAAVRAGRNNEARELQKIVQELDGALEAASPDYRSANDAFAKASREIDQIDAGKAATAPSRRASDTVAEYQRLTPAEQAAYRAGYADKVMGRIENAAVGVDKSRPFTSAKSEEELAALASDPVTLARVLGRERTMFDTRHVALGGSQTADNLADQQGVMGMVRRAPRSLVDALVTGAEWTSRMAKGQNEPTRAALVDALMSTGDDAAANIAKAVARGEKLSQDQQLALQTILYLQGGAVAQVAR